MSSHHIRRQMQRRFLSGEPSSAHSFVRAGLPFTLFSLLAVWVVKNGIEGRQREADVAKGKVSKYVDTVTCGTCFCVHTTCSHYLDRNDRHEWKKRRIA